MQRISFLLRIKMIITTTTKKVMKTEEKFHSSIQSFIREKKLTFGSSIASEMDT